jgi:general secretion pathway protein D
MRFTHVLLCSVCISLVACGTKTPTSQGAFNQSDKHIQQNGANSIPAGSIPQASKRSVVLPEPKPLAKTETYSVVVTNLPARDILFALARDAKINIDIHAGVQGEVTLNAINQTLPQILDRISKQVDMRYELENGNLLVMPDSPFLKSYKIDYVNIAREADGGVTNTAQIGGVAGGGSSQLTIKNSSKNRFWETLVKNITDILRETDKILPAGSSETVVAQNTTTSTAGTSTQAASKKTAKDGGTENSPDVATIEGEGTTVTRRSTFREAASVISSPEAGLITVRATGKQHAKIQDFITQIMRNARRQVLIEATIAEVRLTDDYQQGINWSKLIPAGTKGVSIGQAGTALLPNSATATPGTFILNYTNPNSKFGSLSGSVSLLESFGDVKVLSSPKLSVLNNQTALLRVVDNNVYFIVNSATTPCSPAPCTPIVTYTTTMNSVQVGFTMSITPQINDNDSILLNVRPTITRRLVDAVDPTPGIVANTIPQISTREMESILKIENNQIAILGGLMEDKIDNQSDGIPLLSDIPFFGNLFKYRNDSKTKTELVIFLRPRVIKDASINGDFSDFRDNLPNADFLLSEAEKLKKSENEKAEKAKQ